MDDETLFEQWVCSDSSLLFAEWLALQYKFRDLHYDKASDTLYHREDTGAWVIQAGSIRTTPIQANCIHVATIQAHGISVVKLTAITPL